MAKTEPQPQGTPPTLRPPPPVKPGIEDFADFLSQSYPKMSKYATEANRTLTRTLVDHWNTGTPENPTWDPAAFSYTYDQYLEDVVTLARGLEGQERHLGKLERTAPPAPVGTAAWSLGPMAQELGPTDRELASPPAPPVRGSAKFEPQPVVA